MRKKRGTREKIRETTGGEEEGKGEREDAPISSIAILACGRISGAAAGNMAYLPVNCDFTLAVSAILPVDPSGTHPCATRDRSAGSCRGEEREKQAKRISPISPHETRKAKHSAWKKKLRERSPAHLEIKAAAHIVLWATLSQWCDWPESDIRFDPIFQEQPPACAMLAP